MRFLLIITLFVFQFAYGAEPTPSFFDGIDQAKRTIGSLQAKDFSAALQNYKAALSATDRLSKDDEADILAGRFLIIDHFSKNGNEEAKKDGEALVTKPTEVAYKGLFKELASKGANFAPAYKKNFGLSVIDLLDKAAREATWKATYYRMDERIERYRNPEKAAAAKEDAVMAAGLETKIDQAAHHILSGAFGGKRIATTEEKEAMIQFLFDSAARVVSRKEDIKVLLQNYSGNDSDSPMMKNHIKVCRTILGSVYYFLDKKTRVFDEGVARSIAQLIGSDVDAAFVQKKISQLLEKKLGLIKETSLSSPPESQTTVPITREAAAEKIAEKYKRLKASVAQSLLSLDPAHYQAAVHLNELMAIPSLSLHVSCDPEKSQELFGEQLAMCFGFAEALPTFDEAQYKGLKTLTARMDSWGRHDFVRRFLMVKPKYRKTFLKVAPGLLHMLYGTLLTLEQRREGLFFLLDTPLENLFEIEKELADSDIFKKYSFLDQLCQTECAEERETLIKEYKASLPSPTN